MIIGTHCSLRFSDCCSSHAIRATQRLDLWVVALFLQKQNLQGSHGARTATACVTGRGAIRLALTIQPA